MSLAGAGVRLAASAAGSAGDPVVLLLHGGGQTRHSWGAATRALGRSRTRCVALDLRGHGDSDWAPDGDYSVAAFAADVVEVQQQLALPVVLVGASLGGMVNTYVYWDLTSRQGWPTLVAAIFCLFILAPIVGVVIGTGLFGRLSSRDDSTKIAGSVALIVILNELVFKVWNGDPKFVKSVVPAGSVAVGDSRISSDQMAPIIVAGLVAAGLLFFLTVSGPGKALRAIAENPELAAAYSIDVTRLQALGWAMSTMSSGCSARLSWWARGVRRWH